MNLYAALSSLLAVCLPHASTSFRFLKHQEHEFIVPESELDQMLHDPPSFSSSYDRVTIPEDALDIVSLGSISRLDYFTGQVETWASHKMVRNFWGLTELQDYNPRCVETSTSEIKTAEQKCKTKKAGGLSEFFTRFYGYTEGDKIRSDDAEWMCGQRRMGRVFGWLQSVYSTNELPEYLLLVNDGTYVDLEKVKSHLRALKEGGWAMAECVFPENEK